VRGKKLFSVTIASLNKKTQSSKETTSKIIFRGQRLKSSIKQGTYKLITNPSLIKYLI